MHNLQLAIDVLDVMIDRAEINLAKEGPHNFAEKDYFMQTASTLTKARDSILAVFAIASLADWCGLAAAAPSAAFQRLPSLGPWIDNRIECPVCHKRDTSLMEDNGDWQRWDCDACGHKWTQLPGVF